MKRLTILLIAILMVAASLLGCKAAVTDEGAATAAAGVRRFGRGGNRGVRRRETRRPEPCAVGHCIDARPKRVRADRGFGLVPPNL
jgi:hypothetical protein